MNEHPPQPPQEILRVESPIEELTAASAGVEETTNLDDALDRKILRGSSWAAVGLGGGQVLSLLSTLVLVRLLDPKAFGLAALATTFIIVVQNLQESGLGAALIYRRRDVEAAAACVLVFSLAFSILLSAACALVAPFLATLFHQSALTRIFSVMSLVLVVKSLGVAPGAILEQEMDFRSRAWADVAASVTQAVGAIGLALAGAGVWSLVLGYVAASCVRTAVLWALVPWRPSPRRANWQLFREMVRYGRFVSASNVVNMFNRSLDNLTVGRILGATPLGFYAISFRLATAPVDSVGLIVGRPMFAAYSSLQHDLEAVRRIYVQNLQRVTFLSLPLSVGIAVTAQPIVLAVLGQAWQPVVTPLRILAVYALVKSVTSACGAVWAGLGKPQIDLGFQVVHIVMLFPALILFTKQFGLTGAAAAMLVVDVLSGIPALVVTMRMVDLRPRALGRSLAPTAGSAALLALVLSVLVHVSSFMSAPAALALLVTAAAVVYAAAAAAFARSIVRPMWVSFRRVPHAPPQASR